MPIADRPLSGVLEVASLCGLTEKIIRQAMRRGYLIALLRLHVDHAHPTAQSRRLSGFAVPEVPCEASLPITRTLRI